MQVEQQTFIWIQQPSTAGYKTGGEPNEREMKCDNEAVWIEFLS